jgi:hypothetical protein
MRIEHVILNASAERSEYIEVYCKKTYAIGMITECVYCIGNQFAGFCNTNCMVKADLIRC